MTSQAFPYGTKPPSTQFETPVPIPIAPQSSLDALAEGGTTVWTLPAYDKNSEIVRAFEERWGFAGIRIASDLDYVSFEPSYDSHKHGGDVLDRVAGWAVDQDLPLGPLVAILELVASEAEEQKAQDMLGVFRGKIKDTLEYLRDFGWRGAELAKRADVLEANLPDSLRST
jgi:hypothetical protein